MKIENVRIWGQGEYNYKMAFGFEPNIMFYLHEDDVKRPFMLVLPGGGYTGVWCSEGKVVSDVFYNKGYNVGVFTYTTNPASNEPVKKQALNDLGRAVRYIRKNSEILNVNVDKICVCGFSAAGHVTATIAVHHDDIDEINEEYLKYSPKPNAVILSYPVISTKLDITHRWSVEALIASDVYTNPINYKEELEYFSLENQVNEKTIPCFLWHTATDDAVPVENSYLFAQALQKNKVPYALHIFSEGNHGVSTADEKWANLEFGEPYTFEQIFTVVEAIHKGELKLPIEVEKNVIESEKFIRDYLSGKMDFGNRPLPEISIWVDVAERWLNKVLQ